MRGDNLISELSNEMLQAQLERNIVQIAVVNRTAHPQATMLSRSSSSLQAASAS